MWYCPCCGTENKNNFCAKCGCKRPDTTVVDTNNREKQNNDSKNNNKVLIICISVALAFIVLIISLITVFFVNKSHDENVVEIVETSTPATATEDAAENKPRLYDNHTEFIKTVKRNLGVPDKSSITYNVGEPYYQEVIGTETVYVSFSENGKTVAQAECSTEDGSLARSIINYAAPIDEPVRVAESTPSHYSNIKYYTYTNSRFGYSLPYPDFFTPRQEAGNGSGRVFEYLADSITLSCGGSHTANVFEEASTLDGLYNYYLNNLDYSPTYKTKGDNYFVFSGYKGNYIIYEKYFLKSDGTDNFFRISYPSELKEDLDGVVTYISKNFTTGIGEDSNTVR